MTGRASIVGAAVTHVGKVRDHNEDAHFFDADNGVFLVCDGMGGHAAGEVASAIAIRTIRARWSNDLTHEAADAFVADGTPESKKQLLAVLRGGVFAAHEAIIAEASRDETKTGMGTTLVGAMIVGGDVVFAHAGDSRAYLVRDNIAMQLTEDHTLLSRLLAAGIDVDLTGEGARFKSMLTNALGIGQDCRVSTFVVPLADGDRFLLCSDGISEYIAEAEVGEVLSKAPSPSRAAQKLVDMALERGGGDNATALVVRVLEAGESPLPVERRKRDDEVIAACPLWGLRVNPQQRLRALRIAIPRDHAPEDKLPAQTLGDRVAWIIVEGEVIQDGVTLGPASLLYPESLISSSTTPDKDGLAVAKTDVRALAIRADDFKEVCDEDADLGEALLEALVNVMSRRPVRVSQHRERRGRAPTDQPEVDSEATAVLGIPTKARREEIITQPMPSLGRSDTMPLMAVQDPDEIAPDLQRAKTVSLELDRGPVVADAITVEVPPAAIPPPTPTASEAPALPRTTTKQDPPPAMPRTRVDGGEVLRALWGETPVPEGDVDVTPPEATPPAPAPPKLPKHDTASATTQPLKPVARKPDSKSDATLPMKLPTISPAKPPVAVIATPATPEVPIELGPRTITPMKVMSAEITLPPAITVPAVSPKPASAPTADSTPPKRAQSEPGISRVEIVPRILTPRMRTEPGVMSAHPEPASPPAPADQPVMKPGIPRIPLPSLPKPPPLPSLRTKPELPPVVQRPPDPPKLPVVTVPDRPETSVQRAATVPYGIDPPPPNPTRAPTAPEMEVEVEVQVELEADDPPSATTRPRTLTPDDVANASGTLVGTIEDRAKPAPTAERQKRITEGWEED